MQSITVAKKGANTKIEQYLQTIYPNMSFGTLQKAFRRRDIKANGKRINKDYIVVQGDRLEIFITDELLNGTENTGPGNTGRTAQNSKFSVVYEDNNLIIVNKAQGIPVHPDRRQTEETLIDLVRKYLKEGSEQSMQSYPEHEFPAQSHPKSRHPADNQSMDELLSGKQSVQKQSMDELSADSLPGNHTLESGRFQPSLCHRLDRNTGGLIIIAKNSASHEFILEKLDSREIKKYYQCLVKGKMEKKEARLQAYLWKDATKSRVIISDRKKQGAQEIITTYKVLEYDPDKDISLLEVELVTGRTHQIRAHLAYIGHPIIGDGKYGTNAINRTFGLKQQALWAYRLKFDFLQGNMPLKDNKMPRDNKMSKGSTNFSSMNSLSGINYPNSMSSLNKLNGKEFIVYPEFTIKLKS